jgi:cell division protein FtsL
VKARGAVVATLLGVLLMSALYPIRQYVGQKSHVGELVQQERRLSERISELQRQQGLLLSDDEIERIAREDLGMVRAGEVAFAVLPGSEPGAPDRRAPTVRSPGARGAVERTTWYDRWWDAVKGSLTGIR